MKKDRFTVMFSVSKATGILLDRLDLAIDPFGKGIRYAMLEASQNIAKTSFQGLRRLNHRPEPAVSSPEIPALKIFLGILRIAVAPKPSQRLFDRPGPGCFQLRLPNFVKFFFSPIGNLFLPACRSGRVRKPEVFGTLEAIISLSHKFLMLLAPYFVHCAGDPVSYTHLTLPTN